VFEIIYGMDEITENMDVIRRNGAKAVVLDHNKIMMILTNKGDYKFPGGGLKNGENDELAIRREMLEETGYEILAVYEKIVSVTEQNIDKFDASKIFSMTSNYYLCSVKDDCLYEINLDDYEKEQGFQAVFVPIDIAIEKNSEILRESKRGINDWVRRETDVLLKVKEYFQKNQ
jgi:8-oxo-dGTP pyrophosphatase MutT (NUDIX family)